LEESIASNFGKGERDETYCNKVDKTKTHRTEPNIRELHQNERVGHIDIGQRETRREREREREREETRAREIRGNIVNLYSSLESLWSLAVQTRQFTISFDKKDVRARENRTCAAASKV